MRVKLVVQVLSDTVGNILAQFEPLDEAVEAANLIMDKFLDWLNVRNTVEHELKRKSFLKPYDDRFAWLDHFLDNFRLWKESIE